MDRQNEHTSRRRRPRRGFDDPEVGWFARDGHVVLFDPRDGDMDRAIRADADSVRTLGEMQ